MIFIKFESPKVKVRKIENYDKSQFFNIKYILNIEILERLYFVLF